MLARRSSPLQGSLEGVEDRCYGRKRGKDKIKNLSVEEALLLTKNLIYLNKGKMPLIKAVEHNPFKKKSDLSSSFIYKKLRRMTFKVAVFDRGATLC